MKVRISIPNWARVSEPDILLGGDPEFEVRDLLSGRFVPANRVLYDPDRDAPVGLDGASDTAELRPYPSHAPSGYVENVRKLFKSFLRNHKGYILSIKGENVPIGGHIHIGGSDDEVAELLRDYDVLEKLVYALDFFVGSVLRRANPPAREGSSYNELGAYECKPWGFEYRTPPASYYIHPETVRVVYKLAKGVVKTLLKEGKLVAEKDGSIPSFKSLLRFLTEREARLFLAIPGIYWEKGEIDYALWGVNIPEPPRVKVEFRDDWNTPNMEVFLKEVKKVKGCFPKGTVLHLYGLKSSRGFVFAIPSSPLRMEGDFPHPWRQGREVFAGLPYEIRVERIPSKREVREILSWIISSLSE